MALETGSQPKDLNPDWPLNTDPAQLGAAHLRLIKRILRNYFIGSFSTRQEAKDWYAAANPLPVSGALALVENRWFTFNLISSSANTTEGLDFFIVAPTVQAKAFTDIKQVGFKNSQNTSGLVTINSSQRRRPLVRFSQVLTGSVFDPVAAAAAFPNGAPVQNDICIQLLSDSPSYSFVYRYTGSWQPIEFTVFNTAASFAQFSAQLLSAVSVDTDRVRTVRQEIVGQTNMHVFDPDGFGEDELIEWVGPKEGLVSFNGEIAYGSLTIANAISYKTLTGTGGSGGETPDPPPVIPTNATVLTNIGTLGAVYSSNTTAYNSAEAYAEIVIGVLSNGNFSISGYDEITGSPLAGPYLSEAVPGIGDQFEVKFDVASTTGLSGVFNSWLNLGTSRYVTASVSASSNGAASISADITVSIRKVTTPATVESKVVDIQAFAVSTPGIEP